MFLFFFRIKTAAEQQGKQGLKRTSVQSLHNFVNFGYSNFLKCQFDMDAFLFHSTSRSLYPEVMADLATLDSETFLCQNFQFGINTLFFRSNNNISTQKSR